MNVNQMFPSSWLKKEDVPNPTTATIKHVAMDEVAGDHGKEQKPVIHFVGNLKPMILNRGNADCIAALYGDDTTAWSGKSIELYVDPNVMFGGKRVGGLRVRQPQPQNAFAAQQTAANGFGGEAKQELWDYSDGHQSWRNKTAADVERFLAENKLPASLVRVKPAGAPNSEAKTADQWGFGLPVPLDDPIPF